MPEEDFSKLTVAELKIRLKEMGLPLTGKKADLIARIEEAQNPAEVDEVLLIDDDGDALLIEDEVDDGPAMESRGLLAMANAGPGTNGSQFFITFAPTPHLTGNHTVFGTLTAGDDVLSAIDLRDPASPTSRGEVILEIRIVGP